MKFQETLGVIELVTDNGTPAICPYSDAGTQVVLENNLGQQQPTQKLMKIAKSCNSNCALFEIRTMINSELRFKQNCSHSPKIHDHATRVEIQKEGNQ